MIVLYRSGQAAPSLIRVKFIFALQRGGKGPAALYPGFARRLPSSGGYFQGFEYLFHSKSRTEASGETPHKPPCLVLIFFIGAQAGNQPLIAI